jgi:large subunit ribosomal protein L29
MKGLKQKELQNLDQAQLEKQINENLARLTALQFQKVIGHLDNHSQIQTLRRDIARIKTAMAQRSAASSASVASAPVAAAASKKSR